MEKIDGRKIGVAAQEERKRTIIRMKRSGFKTGEIMEATGCTRQQVSALWIAYRNFKGKNAEEAITRNRTVGRKQGEGRRLTEKQENGIQAILINKYPEQLRFDCALYEGSINAGRVLEFAKHLVKTTPRKVFLIMDNAKTHHSKKLKDWAEKNKEKIELYYLPPYSPDLNPDEHINSDVKYGVGSKRPKRTKEELRKAASAQMRLIQRNPQRVIKYFHDPAIQYAR
jgi:transposase